MKRNGSTALYLKNTTVTLLVIVPLILFITVASGNQAQRDLDEPPIINLPEAAGFTFKVGSADLSPQFLLFVRRELAPRLAQLADSFRCDVVEVIGHTDGQVVGGASNLDARLSGVVHGDSMALVPGSNADLGLMRAWAVILALRRSAGLKNLKFYGLSAGQVIDTSGRYSPAGDFSDTPARRRIEVRLRRSSVRVLQGKVSPGR